MAGTILGVFGKQRSGKTLFAYKVVKFFASELDIPVYTNIYSPNDGFYWINSISDFPLDLEPKILFIDEVYNGTDSQDYRRLKEVSIFLNTLGKQNCLFVYTSIDSSMVYNRLRNQTQYAVLVNSDTQCIYYRWTDISRAYSRDFQVIKCPELFKNVSYDTNFIPLDFDWCMDAWKEKLAAFYLDSYKLDISRYIQ
ncbi:MAG: hypothetical protein PHV18_14160 [Lachnospiraceae bacterium]|nr:hypothetical protein [Lachnospiraceae bacterium]